MFEPALKIYNLRFFGHTLFRALKPDEGPTKQIKFVFFSTYKAFLNSSAFNISRTSRTFNTAVSLSGLPTKIAPKAKH